MTIQITTELLIKVAIAILSYILFFKVLKVHYAIITLIYGGYLLYLKSKPEKWAAYQGKIFVKEYMVCHEFFKNTRSYILSTCPEEGPLIFTGTFKLKDFPEEYRVRLQVHKQDGKIPEVLDADNVRFEILTPDYQTVLFSTDELDEISKGIELFKSKKKVILNYSDDYYGKFHKFFQQISVSMVRTSENMGIVLFQFTPDSGWAE